MYQSYFCRSLGLVLGLYFLIWQSPAWANDNLVEITDAEVTSGHDVRVHFAQKVRNRSGKLSLKDSEDSYALQVFLGAPYDAETTSLYIAAYNKLTAEGIVKKLKGQSAKIYLDKCPRSYFSVISAATVKQVDGNQTVLQIKLNSNTINGWAASARVLLGGETYSRTIQMDSGGPGFAGNGKPAKSWRLLIQDFKPGDLESYKNAPIEIEMDFQAHRPECFLESPFPKP